MIPIIDMCHPCARMIDLVSEVLSMADMKTELLFSLVSDLSKGY